LANREQRESEQNKISLFPVPADNYIDVSLNNKFILSTEIGNAQVYDSKGILVKQMDFKGANFRLEVEDLDSGIYFIVFKFQSDFEIKSSKFLIN
jgi:hypothetical protein